MKINTSFKNKTCPEYFELSSIGESKLGFISVAEFPNNIPFEIKRAYWTYYTPQDVLRGHHSHKDLYQLIFALSGTITFYTEDRHGNKQEFVLSEPNVGLFIPPYVWREINFSHNSVLLCLASSEYLETDYLRSYENFINILNNNKI
jgi:dTDP-4-dehydrorhamnose 3,5-epimerase-like enzyme